MAQPAIAGKGPLLAHLRSVSPNAPFQRNRSTAGCPLVRISHTLPANVAQALVPAVSRLVSTLGRDCDEVPKGSVGMSADAAGTSARATGSHTNSCEKCGLAPAMGPTPAPGDWGAALLNHRTSPI